MTNKKIQNSTGGFTLIETLVAVLLLATAVAGPLTIASKSLTTALVAKDQISAYYLAQDAIEFVRFARDTNKLAGTDWLTGTINLTPCLSASGCYLDSTQNNPAAPTVCSVAECAGQPLYYDSTSGKYGYSVGTKSIFTRAVSLTTVTGNTDEIAVTVKVIWSDLGSITHTLTARENLYNWQP